MVEKIFLLCFAAAAYGAYLLLAHFGLQHVAGFLVALYIVWSANHILGHRSSIGELSDWVTERARKERDA